MPTLAQQLGTTAPVSPLLRKARRVGINGIGDAMALAVLRGCKHYPIQARQDFRDPGELEFSSDELVILLLLGEQPYEPMAIRCAAQMARSADVDPIRLARLARQALTVRSLAHIARSGVAHDPDDNGFWQKLLEELRPPPARSEPELPHWSRFVSSPGYQRNGMAKTVWLAPAP